ncbi:MAG: hypothetical protein K0U76_14025 [Actinomycetia bacterium]|nr:hypothetical protein [Actinomycetes bacterium]MCH9702467.1 hypothetical protein [Actinomycetes bacterium]MCH9760221.1 hypothetical protein [Actinomycetes bacterium]
MIPTALGKWGLLPILAPLAAATILGLAALVLNRSTATNGERLLAGAVTWVAVVAAGVRILGAAGALNIPVLAGSAVVVAVCVGVAVWVRAVPVPVPVPRRWPVSVATAPVLVVATIALAIAGAAAYLLPVWQWDALGYHLPYVNFALQDGTLASVPPGVPYLSTYPKVVEDTFIAWRAMLPDDSLVDLAQLPFGLLGALAISVIARRLGARSDAAAAAGAVWLTLPAVLLQLPTNYVDVASAALALSAVAFLLGPAERGRLLLAAVPLGLFLGSKPSAGLAVVLLFAALTLVAIRARLTSVVPLAGLLVMLLGAETYLRNIVHKGNPVWPVAIELGPVHLPGESSIAGLLAAGAAAPRTHGNVVERVIGSWSVIWPQVPVFDMRVGGLGIVVLVALPVAVVHLFRHCRGLDALVLGLIVVATLATPEPAVARFVLAFAGLVLAAAAPATEWFRDRRWSHILVFGLVAAGAAQNVVAAYPGLRGEGPALGAYLDMTDAQRRRAVGAAGPPGPFVDAVEAMRPGQIAVFDGSVELPYRVWPYDLSTAAQRIPDEATVDDIELLLGDERIALLLVGTASPTAQVVRDHPGSFRWLFDCPATACAVYVKRAP